MDGRDFNEKMQRGLPLNQAENAKVRDLLERFDGNDGVNDSYIARLSRANSRAEEAEAEAEALAEALEPFLRGTGPDRGPRPPTWETAGQHVVWLKKGEWEAARDALARHRGEK